jgi:ABC-type dipeptide/oligopeptide/nickel transport system permease subunit
VIDRTPIRGRSPWALALERLRRDRAAVGSAVVILLAVLVAVAAPLAEWATGHSPIEQYGEQGLSDSGIPVGPCPEFWLGTDGLGRDVLVRLAYGTRVSLLVGVLASGLAVLLGAAVGLLAGWRGGAIDAFLSRLMDTVLSLPFLVLAIALAALVGPGLGVSVLVIAFFSWASVGRVIRAEALALREREFVLAARALGASDARIVLVELLPMVAGTAIIYASLLIPSSIAFEATLSFLGLGMPAPTPSWGSMLAEAMPYLRVAWWLLLFPGAALLGLTVAFNLLGDGVRDALDPRYDQSGPGRGRGGA